MHIVAIRTQTETFSTAVKPRLDYQSGHAHKNVFLKGWGDFLWCILGILYMNMYMELLGWRERENV